MDIGETLDVTEPKAFRRWLSQHHMKRTEIWLVQYKKSTGKPSIRYADAVDEAICFGWIDGFEKGLDSERFVTRFTPRRPKSHWTDTNKDRARRLIASGKMTPAGLASLPPDVAGALPKPRTHQPRRGEA